MSLPMVTYPTPPSFPAPLSTYNHTRFNGRTWKTHNKLHAALSEPYRNIQDRPTRPSQEASK